MTKLVLSERALADIDAIERYSVERWGERVASQYLADLDAALARLASDISLFRERYDYTGRLRFYNVREHVLVGDIIEGTVFILTVWHGSMDFIERLPSIEPDLVREAETLTCQIEVQTDRE